MNHQTDPTSKGHGLDGLYDALRRPGIARASDGRWFAGVASGLARWQAGRSTAHFAAQLAAMIAYQTEVRAAM